MGIESDYTHDRRPVWHEPLGLHGTLRDAVDLFIEYVHNTGIEKCRTDDVEDPQPPITLANLFFHGFSRESFFGYRWCTDYTRALQAFIMIVEAYHHGSFDLSYEVDGKRHYYKIVGITRDAPDSVMDGRSWSWMQ